jgi:hypothetical protein
MRGSGVCIVRWSAPTSFRFVVFGFWSGTYGECIYCLLHYPIRVRGYYHRGLMGGKAIEELMGDGRQGWWDLMLCCNKGIAEVFNSFLSIMIQVYE